ncbi:MAG: helix-turn-helix domain-containing protein [Lachnospiraceae bacterium]|nr:helix-turn-helix domain-containing protein [Lachnospiraceae bacterium]
MNNSKTRKSNKPVIMPKTERQLERVGEQIKLARLRRNYSVKVVSERAGISRATLWKVEKGDPGVAIGIYAKVLTAIGLPDDIILLARDDELGRIIQDSELLSKRGSRK